MARFKGHDVLRWSHVPWFGARFEYDKDLVDELKGFSIRAWDAATRTWWFPDVFLPHVTAIARNRFGERAIDLNHHAIPLVQYRRQKVNGDLAPMREDVVERDLVPFYNVIGVLPTVPNLVLDTAYNAMKYYLDPERNLGGTDEPLQALEKAYVTVLRARGRIP